jgi:Chromo (CHRromatin Organisation MOdifier) domain
MSPFELALTRPPPTLSLQALPRADEVALNTLKREFLERLKTLRLRAGENLHKAQVRYKKSYDRGVVRKDTELSVGDEAYLRVEITDVGRNQKLESFVQRSYRVVENVGKTLRLCIGDETVRVSSGRVTRAPTRPTPSIPTLTPEIPSDPVTTPPAREKDAVPRKPKPHTPEEFGLPFLRLSPIRVREKMEYVVHRLVDAQMNGMGQILYQVRWLGYDPADDTWEEKDELPTHLIRRYWRIKGLSTLEGEHTLTNGTSGQPLSRPPQRPFSPFFFLALPSPPPHPFASLRPSPESPVGIRV